MNYLAKKPAVIAVNIIRWVLLVFVLASLVITIYRVSDRKSVPEGISLFEQLQPDSRDQVMVVLFHFRERCETCLNMEQYTRGFLQDYNRGKGGDDSVRFQLEVINDNRNVNLVRHFNTYTSTLVLIVFENGEEKQVKVLNNAWQLHRDQEAYTAMLENEIESFIQQHHE